MTAEETLFELMDATILSITAISANQDFLVLSELSLPVPSNVREQVVRIGFITMDSPLGSTIMEILLLEWWNIPIYQNRIFLYLFKDIS